MIVATPDADEAERCSRLGVISRGSIVDQGTPQELIERYTSRLVEVTVDNQRAARETLRATDGVVAVSGIGGSLRVSLTEDGPGAEELARVLEDHGRDVTAAQSVEPRLEDALLVLEAREGNDGDV